MARDEVRDMRETLETHVLGDLGLAGCRFGAVSTRRRGITGMACGGAGCNCDVPLP